MDLYAKRVERLVKYNVEGKLSPTASRFSSFNIPVNGVYPGRYVVGRHDSVNMIPPGMNPYEK